MTLLLARLIVFVANSGEELFWGSFLECFSDSFSDPKDTERSSKMGKVKELAEPKKEILSVEESIEFLTQWTNYFQCKQEDVICEDTVIAGMYYQFQLLRKEDEYEYLTKELHERLRTVTNDSELQAD